MWMLAAAFQAELEKRKSDKAPTPKFEVDIGFRVVDGFEVVRRTEMLMSLYLTYITL